jgi:organic hydroperoxide reductase OsmC/OhrA
MPKPHLFRCQLVWTGAAAGATKSYDSYSRNFRIAFAGKPPLQGSAAGVYKGDDALPNPEDLLVASLSSCHFLSYLAVCARAAVEVVDYKDDAEGTMQIKDGAMRFTEVILRPQVLLAPGADLAKAEALHERAHHDCFIANSVNFPVRYQATVTIRGYQNV